MTYISPHCLVKACLVCVLEASCTVLISAYLAKIIKEALEEEYIIMEKVILDFLRIRETAGRRTEVAVVALEGFNVCHCDLACGVASK